MSQHETSHQTDEKSGDESAKDATGSDAKRTAQAGQKNQNDWRPEPPDEAAVSGQKAQGGSAPGEKLHGEKLQSAAGSRDTGGGQSGGRQH